MQTVTEVRVCSARRSGWCVVCAVVMRLCVGVSPISALSSLTSGSGIADGCQLLWCCCPELPGDWFVWTEWGGRHQPCIPCGVGTQASRPGRAGTWPLQPSGRSALPRELALLVALPSQNSLGGRWPACHWAPSPSQLALGLSCIFVCHSAQGQRSGAVIPTSGPWVYVCMYV